MSIKAPTLTTGRTDSVQPFESPAQTRDIHHESETVTPDHPDVRSWAETERFVLGLSPTEIAKYEAESKELWEKFDEGPPRMIRTAHGARVHYGQQELR
jgi:hypothetical protein